jgi:hypothetical protein
MYKTKILNLTFVYISKNIYFYLLVPSSNDTDNKNSSEPQDTFAERLQMQILRNLELQISNIHVRYEDDFSKPEHPFSAGITLSSIEIKTADENWNPTFLKEDKIKINKVLFFIILIINNLNNLQYFII